MSKKILKIVFFFIAFIIFNFSQKLLATDNQKGLSNECSDKLHEIVYLHLSKSSAVVGERLFFKAYIVNKINFTESNSKILYIELVDSHNRLKTSCRSNISNGSCESSILIPDSLTTGLYRIVAYTNLMRNFPQTTYLYSSLIVVGFKNNINIKADGKNSTDTVPGSGISNASCENNSNDIFDVKINKSFFGRKEKVNLQISLRDSSNVLNGNYSISVSEKLPGKYSELNPEISSALKILSGDTMDAYNSGEKCKALLKLNREYLNWQNSLKKGSSQFPSYKFETSSYLLEGIVTDKNTKSLIPGKTLLLTTPDSIANIKYSITDSLGKFIFALDTNYDNKKIILNVNDPVSTNEYFITLDNKQISNNGRTFDELYIDDAMNDFLQKSKKIAVINKTYYRTNSSPPIIPNSNFRNNFFGKPYLVVRLADFIELDDFSDITKNIVPGVKFKKKRNGYSITIRDTRTNQETYPENCLVLLNNIPFYDYDYLASLGSSQLDRIEVCCKHAVYGNIDFYGVLSVFTKDKVLIPNKQALVFDNKVENFSYQFYQQNLSSDKINEKIPLFKQVLLWNPDLILDRSGITNVEFNTSDLAAEYVVDIEGLTNSGKPVSKKISFKVQ